MPIVRSLGRLTSVTRGGAGHRAGAWPLSADAGYALATHGLEGTGYVRTSAGSYATIYRTQPAVRTVVDFIARNIAQLGLHIYERLADNNRQRDTTSGLARLLARPNPFTTTYRLIEHTLIDWGTFGNGYIVKLRPSESSAPVELWRVPASRVTVAGELYPVAYGVLAFDNTWFEIPASEVIHIRDGKDDDAGGVLGLSKLETLRKRLLEESHLQNYRLNYWRQGARIPGVVQRPLEAPEWDDEARARFRQSFSETYGGPDGAGLVPVLDEGMTYVGAGHSAEQQQLNEARELHDEEVVRAYQMPLSTVQLLRRATFANIREQHKALYQDGLGPIMQMVEQELELSLVPHFYEPGTAYVEFNFDEKLRGSFEERASALAQATGRPWLSVNEARAIENLPKSTEPDDDKIAAPLNMRTGGTAAALHALASTLSALAADAQGGA